ncbi:Glutamyl endopeptidase precursor, blaSE [hydrothermal vent metagenome]|uniref:Glutamyl endopeptidase, blaSE n=1 Tax=hydrothermal vent metagenome TaxID=652676 RepID=A0A3B0WAU5_9ZZZZ
MNNSYDEIVANSNATETNPSGDLDANKSCGPDAEHASSASISESAADGDVYEAGFDVQTHGGGQLETVAGFEYLGTMIEGIGTEDDFALPEASETISSAGRVEFNDYQESVCGVDDRVQIDPVANVPWRMIAQLIITLPNGMRVRGTGWFISPRTLMTAGHCVFSHQNGGWAQSIEVIPAMNGRKRPFGSATSTNFKSVKGWTENKETSHDYGCIILPETSRLGDKTGWFGYANLSDTSLESLLANNSGYPGDKSFGTQWYNAGRISKVTDKRLHYMIDTAPGQSGSPTWKCSASKNNMTGGGRSVIGIHNYGGCANKSTRINKAVFSNMTTWKQQGL